MKDTIRKFATDIKIEPNSIQKLNPQFALCDILVCYPNENRNRTFIKKSVIEEALYSLYGVPIVGEWVYKLDGTDEKTWGSHGGKIIIDDSGIHYERTTESLGFVTHDAVQNYGWVDVLEKDGITSHEYLKLSGCILWAERIEETKSILEKNFGQSMEVEFTKGHLREDGYYEADEMVFSALCVLGTAEPCFESAMIGRHFAYESARNEFDKKVKEFKKFMKKEVDPAMYETITNILKEITFNAEDGTNCEKYILIGVGANEIDVIDREDNYSVFTFSYSQDDKSNVLIDFNKKTKKSLGAVDKAENGFVLNNEILRSNRIAVKKALDNFTSTTIDNLNDDITALKKDYDALLGKYQKASNDLETYKEKEIQEKELAHKNEIDNKIAEYEQQMGRCSDFLTYKATLDYSKSVDEVNTDMLLMLGKHSKDSNPTVYKYQNYSIFSPDFSGENDLEHERYGDIFDKVNV